MSIISSKLVGTDNSSEAVIYPSGALSVVLQDNYVHLADTPIPVTMADRSVTLTDNTVRLDTGCSLYIVDSEGNVLGYDGTMPSIDWAHYYTHKGLMHIIQQYNASMNAGTAITIGITVGNTADTDMDRGLHIRINGSVANGGVLVTIQSVTGFTSGTAITPFNLNTNFSNTLTSTFNLASGLTGAATIYTDMWGGSSSTSRSSLPMNDADEIILKPNTKYVISFTSLVSATSLTINLQAYEELP